MPRKIRQLKKELIKAGFVFRPGKGSHTVWTHPNFPEARVVLSGHDGDDAQPFHERDLRIAKRLIDEEAEE